MSELALTLPDMDAEIDRDLILPTFATVAGSSIDQSTRTTVLFANSESLLFTTLVPGITIVPATTFESSLLTWVGGAATVLFEDPPNGEPIVPATVFESSLLTWVGDAATVLFEDPPNGEPMIGGGTAREQRDLAAVMRELTGFRPVDDVAAATGSTVGEVLSYVRAHRDQARTWPVKVRGRVYVAAASVPVTLRERFARFQAFASALY